MNLRTCICSALCALPLLGLAAPSLAIVPAYTPINGPQPRISERQAVEIGLNRVPQGTVQAARLENQNGRQVWFLDIAGYNGRSRQEMLVDAETGRVMTGHARALTGPSTAPTTARATG
jgi:hypothetical protein